MIHQISSLLSPPPHPHMQEESNHHLHTFTPPPDNTESFVTDAVVQFDDEDFIPEVRQIERVTVFNSMLNSVVCGIKNSSRFLAVDCFAAD